MQRLVQNREKFNNVHRHQLFIRQLPNVRAFLHRQLHQHSHGLRELRLYSHKLKPGEQLLELRVQRREVSDEAAKFAHRRSFQTFDVDSDVLQQLRQDFNESFVDFCAVKREHVSLSDHFDDFRQIRISCAVKAEISVELIGVVFLDFYLKIAQISGEFELVT